MENEGTADEIKALRRKLSEKKGSITKRVNQIMSIISTRGSRVKVEYLHKAMLMVHEEVKKLHNEFLALKGDIEEDWLEDINLVIDDCTSDLHEYLESRKGDAASSLAETWVNRHLELMAQGGSDDGSIEELLTKLNDVSLPNAEETQESQASNVRVDNNMVNLSNPVGNETGFSSVRKRPVPSHATFNLTPSALTVPPTYDTKRWPPQSDLKSEATSKEPLYMTNSTGMGPTWSGDSHGKKENLNEYFQPLNETRYLPGPKTSVAEMNYWGKYAPKLNEDNHPRRRPDDTNARLTQPKDETIHKFMYAPLPERRLLRPDVNQTNEVDSWIDELRVGRPDPKKNTTGPDVSMAWFIQQSLPRIKIPQFDGAPTIWVEFIMKFKDLVHDQGYLTDVQRNTYLKQHLSGEAKRAVQGYPNNEEGYIQSLRRLKFMFEQKSRVAQATLMSVTRGKQIGNDDHNGLVEFYYTIGDCLVTLKQLNYLSDLYSSDVLRQAVRRLPFKFYTKWSEHCLAIRRREEPNLMHLEAWLQDRVLASKESYLPDRNQLHHIGRSDNKSKFNERERRIIASTNITSSSCHLCKAKHRFWKCTKYQEMSPSERFQQVKTKKLCYNCLKADHFTSKCSSSNSCFTKDCSQRHHTTLHDYFNGERTDDNFKYGKKDEKWEEKKDKFSGMVKSPRNQFVHLQIVPVVLHGSNGETVSTNALLDSGSQATLIRNDVVRKLELKGKQKTVSISTIKDGGESLHVKEVSLYIGSTDGSTRMKVESAYAISTDKFKMPKHSLSFERKRAATYPYLKDIPLHSASNEEIDILIGANVPDALLPLDVRKGNEGQPMAIKTQFGWTLFGSSNQEKNHKMHCNTITVTCDEDMHSLVQQFWAQENCALTDRQIANSIQDEVCLEKFDKQTKTTGEKYEVPMLWENEQSCLPDNYAFAFNRFQMLLKRLRKDETLWKQYNEVITTYLQRGYAKRMSREEIEKNPRVNGIFHITRCLIQISPGNSGLFLMQPQDFKGRA